MIEIESATSRTLEIGEMLELRWHREDPAVEVRVLLENEGILYLRPLRDWTQEENLLFFPEAPGRYTFVLQWRRGESDKGTRELGIEVGARRSADFLPFRIQIDDEIQLWTPSEWEGRILKVAERAVLDVLQTLVEPGAVVYDVGANLGLFAITLARKAGAGGRVYCLEANPICLQFLRANLALNEAALARAGKITVLPVAVLDQCGTIDFTLNYGNSNLGSTAVNALYAAKSGHEIQVPAYEIDRLIEDFELAPPDLIKLDVEGAECQAVRGMRGLLARARPTLLLELHGEGNARWTLEELDRLGYRYVEPLTRSDFESSEEVVLSRGNTVFQILAVPRDS